MFMKTSERRKVHVYEFISTDFRYASIITAMMLIPELYLEARGEEE